MRPASAFGELPVRPPCKTCIYWSAKNALRGVCLLDRTNGILQSRDTYADESCGRHTAPVKWPAAERVDYVTGDPLP